MSFCKVGRLTRRNNALTLATLLVVAVVGCDDKASPSLPEAEVGLFYGGQVQRLKTFELSTVNPPKFGFRVSFPQVQAAADESRSRRVSYEIVRPGPAGRRVTQEGVLELPRQQQRLDHLVELPESSRPGTWNVRVVAEGTILADRALNLVAPR